MSSTPAIEPEEQVAPESVPDAQTEEEQQERPGSDTTRTEKQDAPEKSRRPGAMFLPPYKVILFNDDENEMNFVVAVLLRLINHLSQTEALRIMLTAHLTGSAVVVVCPKERAEYYQDRLSGYGLSAAIEPE